MTIQNLRVNHLENPLGFKMDVPVMSWTVENCAGKRQKAARVRVSLDENLDSCVFDSGFVEDISSLGYAPDVSLLPRTRYYWAVEVMSDDDEAGISPVAWFETAKMDEMWNGAWIKAPFDKDVHPVFKKRVSLSSNPRRARIYMTGLGVYELTVNGIAASDEVLAPFYNDYGLWVQYQTYDVTPCLHSGENYISVALGNGWYKGRFGFVPEMKELYGDEMKLMLEIRVEMEDGTEIVVGTDESWMCDKSPVVESSIYDGEVYDARLEKPFDSFEGAKNAVLCAPSEGELTARLSPPLRICDTLRPEKLLFTPAGEWVLDFGQVMTGWVEFDCDLPEGQEVQLYYGELLQNECFYRENLRTAKEEYRYISSGKPGCARPRFTFYGFRFVKVTGMNVDPDDFTAKVIHSDIKITGSIETSNDKVNRLIKNAFWGQIGNFLDVPTDCPQRDERMGWTGDAHVFAPTASFNMYTPAFYDKFLYDMRLEQRKMGGAVAHVVPDVLDRIASIRHTPIDAFGSCAWGDAAVGIPWTLYAFYGDKKMLEEQYENMLLWVDWIRKQDEELCGGCRLWKCGFHFADWLALDNPEKGSSFGGTDPYFIASAYYYYSTYLTARAAEVLGREEDRARLDKVAGEVLQAMRHEYFTASGRIAVPTQTAMIMSLYMGIVPEKHRLRIINDLREKLKSRDWHMDTGFVGTYYLCQTLTQNGMSDIAYTLLLNEDYPSWLYEVNMGATTIWERWNSVLPNGLVSDTGMNSMNHYAYGSVVEWIYRAVLGINPDLSCPGFKKCVISPKTDKRLDWAKAKYESASGLYEVSWKHVEDGMEYEVTVPFDCEADFIPERPPCEAFLNGRIAGFHDGCIRLEAGKHIILCK